MTTSRPRPNLFMLEFFGGFESDRSDADYADFARCVSLVWPAASDEQVGTIVATAQNWPRSIVQVYRRPATDVMVVEALGARHVSSEAVFAAKVERDGSYS
jgi:hypothetical protein